MDDTFMEKDEQHEDEVAAKRVKRSHDGTEYVYLPVSDWDHCYGKSRRTPYQAEDHGYVENIQEAGITEFALQEEEEDVELGENENGEDIGNTLEAGVTEEVAWQKDQAKFGGGENDDVELKEVHAKTENAALVKQKDKGSKKKKAKKARKAEREEIKAATEEVKPVQRIIGFCRTCRAAILEHKTKRCRFLSGRLQQMDIKAGIAAREMGINITDKEEWTTSRLCYDCYHLMTKWFRCKLKFEKLTAEWSAKTGVVTNINPFQARPFQPPYQFPNQAPNQGPRPKYARKKPAMKNWNSPQMPTVVRLLCQSKYQGALGHLLKQNRRFKKVYVRRLAKDISSEMKSMRSKDKSAFNRSSLENLNDFSWSGFVAELKKAAPITFHLMAAALMSDPEELDWRSNLHPKLAMMFSIPLFHRFPFKHKLLPVMAFFQMWRHGATRRVLQVAQLLGITPAPRAVQKSSNKLIQAKAQDMDTWQKSFTQEPVKCAPVVFPESSSHIADFSICWGPSPTSENEISVYAVRNRVSFKHITEEDTCTAHSLPVTKFLPSQQDYESLRKRMTTVVQRILVHHLGYFKDTADSVVRYIPHSYSEQSVDKNQIKNLGVIECDPSTDEGALEVMNFFTKFVPATMSYIPVHGDIRSTGMMVKAQNEKHDPRRHQLRRFLAVPHESDFKATVLQDTMDEFLKTTTKDERGTLGHLKHYFGFKTKISDLTVTQTQEFMQVVTKSFVAGLAMDAMGISDPQEEPYESQNKEDVLRDVAKKVMTRVWRQLPMTEIANVVDAEIEGMEDRFCFCKRYLNNTDMIECSNVLCNNGRWFHQKCVKYKKDESSTADWFCSEECVKSGNSAYCLCRRRLKKETPMIKCGNTECPRGHIFHWKCVSVDSYNETEDGPWYCCPSCLKEATGVIDDDDDDAFSRYIETVTWRGLLHEAMMDAESQGDGEAMLSHWRLYMPEFWNRGHHHYLAMAHRLLAGVSGCLPERVRLELIHNRTVNVRGGAGWNTGLDMPKKTQTKENKRTNNQKTQDTKDKCVIADRARKEFTEALGRPLDLAFSIGPQSLPNPPGLQWAARYHSQKAEVGKFLCDFAPERMFAKVPGRRLRSLPDFSYEVARIQRPENLKETLVELSNSYDLERLV